MTIAGVVLLARGLIALVYQGVWYTSRGTVINDDSCSWHATLDRQKTLPIPPIAGLAAAAGGVALLIAGRRKTT